MSKKLLCLTAFLLLSTIISSNVSAVICTSFECDCDPRDDAPWFPPPCPSDGWEISVWGTDWDWSASGGVLTVTGVNVSTDGAALAKVAWAVDGSDGL